MARTPEDGLNGQSEAGAENAPEVIQANGQDVIALPSADFVTDAEILRDGQDLVLEGPDGSTVVIEGYFNADPAPLLQAENGQTLTPNLVESFVQHVGPVQYAQAGTANDESPVGAVQEASGQSTVTRTDGSSETITIGTPIYEGDIIETSDDGAVNIIFVDETSFAVSQNAKLAIDEYVFDPASESGSSDFSVVRGLFVFTSGLIGRDDPDDVTIDTPMGSIGIRGTVIVGNVNTGEITVMEGAIVMRGFDGSELTMTEQFETGRFEPATGEITYLGKTAANDFSNSYDTLKPVSPDLFSGMDDSNQDNTGLDGNTQPSDNPDGNDPAQDPANAAEQSGGEEPPPEDATDPNSDPANAGPVPEGEMPPADGQPPEPAVPADDGTFTDTTFGGPDAGFDDAAGTGGNTNNAAPPPPPPSSPPPGETTGATAPPPPPANEPPPPPPLPVDITIDRALVDDDIVSGDVVAMVSTANGLTGLNFSLVGAKINGVPAAGDFTIVGAGVSAAIKYTGAGLTLTDVLEFGIKATAPNGESKTEGFTVTVDDLMGIANIGAVDSGSGLPILNIDENTTGTIADMTAVITNDEAPAGQVVTWTLISATSENATDVSGNISIDGAFGTANQAQIRLDSSVDSEIIGDFMDVVVEGQTIDDAGQTMTFTKTFHVLVGNLDDTAPTLDLDANDSSLATGDDYNTTFAEGGSGANVVDTDVDIADVDGGAINGAAVTITNIQDAGDETLFVAGGDQTILGITITGSGTGAITLSGLALQSSYESVLKMIQYQNVNAAPETATTRQVDITVTDGGSNVSTTSSSFIDVTATNDAPTGSVVITGTATEDQTLTATDSLADADGLGAFSYQWHRDGVDIGGATASTFVLGDADVGTDITVTVSYTDGQGNPESVTSAGTGLIANVNDAPVLNNTFSPVMTSVNEDDANPAGDTVAGIVSDTSITDADGAAVEAIAVVGIPLTNGTWEFSTNAGSTWTDMNGLTISNTNALLLGPTDMVRFVPNADYNGTEQLTFRAWDQSTGTAGSQVDVSTNGGTTAFSTAVDTADVTVTAVNDAPVLDLDTVAGGVNYNTTYVEGNATLSSIPVVNAGNISLTDSDSTLVSVTINLTNVLDGTLEDLFVSGANITTAGTTHNINVAFSNNDHTVTLTDLGGATNIDFEAVLQFVEYRNNDDTPNTTVRQIDITADDGTTQTTASAFLNITPTLDSDTLTGTAGVDTIQGDGGNDTIDGQAGNDTLSGGAGNDIFTTTNGDGDDIIDGQIGSDTYDASSVTNDLLFTFDDTVTDIFATNGADTDTLRDIETFSSGTSLNDKLQFTGTTGVTVDLSLGTNQIVLDGMGRSFTISGIENVDGSVGNDFITGSASANILDGGAGNDTFIAADGDGNDNITGGLGIDKYDASAVTTPINVDLTLGTNQVTGGAGTDTVSGIEEFIGTGAADTFKGDANANIFRGGGGGDTFILSSGNDQIFGDVGAGDTYDASATANIMNINLVTGNIFDSVDTDAVSGVENFITGTGFDTFVVDTVTLTTAYDFDGGGGIDLVNYSSLLAANSISVNLTAGADTVTITSGSSDVITNIENIIGTQGNDSIAGNSDAAANVLDGGAGNDFLTGGAGDTLIGGAGNDFLRINVDNIDLQGGVGTDRVEVFTAGTFDSVNFTGFGNIESISLADAGSTAATLDLDVTGNLFANDTPGNFDVHLDATDTLNLDFTPFGGGGVFALTAGDLVSGGTATFFNSTTSDTLNVIYTAGATITEVGAAGPIGLDLNTLGGADGFKITDNIDEGFAFSMAALGDRNNDGFDDIAFVKATNTADGRTFILDGQAGTFTDMTLAGMTQSHTGLINDGTPNGINMDIAGGGDFNGDGVLDYVVGGLGASSPTTAGSGSAQIVDGATGAILVTLDGMLANDLTGQSVDFVGDLNMDGYDDVIIGAPGSDTGGTNAGAAYVLFGDDSGATVDVTDMVQGQILDNASVVTSVGNTRGIGIDEGSDRAFIIEVAAGTDHIQVVDISNPAAPASGAVWNSAFVDTAGATSTGAFETIISMHVEHGKVFVVSKDINGTDGHLTVLNASDGSLVGNFQDASLLDVKDIYFDEATNKAIVTTSNATDGGVHIFDIDPSGGAVASVTGVAPLAFGGEVVVYNNHAYISTTGGAGTVEIVNLATPTHVGALSTSVGTLMENPASFVIEGDFLYMLDDNTGAGTGGDLVIFDLSGGAIPANEIGSHSFGAGDFKDITIQDGMVYAVDATGNNIFVIDVSNPANPVEVDVFNDPGALNGVKEIVAGYDGEFFAVGDSGFMVSGDFDFNGMAIDGLAAGDLLGLEVSSAGDFNDDGFEDFMVAIPGAGGVDSGSVALVLGGDSMRNFDISDNTTYIEITNIDVLASDTIPLINIGDMSGDGISDIAVVSTQSNEIYILNGDVAKTPTNNSNMNIGGDIDTKIVAATGFEIVGGAAAGDFNGDGFDDLVIAMRDTVTGAGDQVSLYVLYGQTAMSVMYDNNPGGLNNLNDSTQAFLMTYTIPGVVAGDHDPANFEFEISSAGDLNGDGFADLVIGLPDLDDTPDANAVDQDGSALVVYGRDTDGTIITDNDGTDADVTVGTVLAAAANQSLVGTSGNDILIDGNFFDVSMSGGAGDDTIAINNDQFQNIDGGGGFDTLRLTDTPGWTLDLTNVGSEKFQNIEAIDMLDANSHTVVLGMDDVFDMMQSSPTDTAKIEGDLNDIFVIEMPDFDHAPSGVLFDNNFSTFNAGEGDLFDFGIRTAEAGGFSSFSFGSGYSLWVSDAILDANSVIIGSNIVTDNDVTDGSGVAGTIHASAGEQTLVGGNGIDNFDDVGQFNISMFGLGGDDILTVTNGNFDMVNGGTGNDTLVIDANIDLRSLHPDDISHIEALSINATNTLTLSKSNLLNMIASADGGILTINGTAGESLKIDDQGGLAFAPGASTAQIAAALGSTDDGLLGGFYEFSGIGGTLRIDQALVDNTNTEIL